MVKKDSRVEEKNTSVVEVEGEGGRWGSWTEENKLSEFRLGYVWVSENKIREKHHRFFLKNNMFSWG